MEPHTPVVRSTQKWVLHSPAQAGGRSTGVSPSKPVSTCISANSGQ